MSIVHAGLMKKEVSILETTKTGNRDALADH